ncbi:MAG TPA: hypothetical protein VGF22_07840 [Acidimicrobiales bacterium]|jgi:hypothetical protein
MAAALRQLMLGVLVATLVIVVGSAATAYAQSATSAPAPVAPAPATTIEPTGDTVSSRTVNRIVLALLAMAGLLAILTFWLWRVSKPKANHLDGLDAMGSRRWRAATPERRAAILGPVHLRRGEIRDDDLVAAPEPVEALVPVEPQEAVEAVETPVPVPVPTAVEALAPPVVEPASDGSVPELATSLEAPAAPEPAKPSDEPAA